MKRIYPERTLLWQTLAMVVGIFMIADVRPVIWSGAYANARVAVAPDASVIPRLDASAELYQALGQAWEVSAGYRRMQFATDGVNILTISAARHLPGWYALARASAAPEGGQTGVALTGSRHRWARWQRPGGSASRGSRTGSTLVSG